MPEQIKDNFTVLYEIAQKINSILDQQELLDKVLEIAMSHLDAERGFIVMVDDSAVHGFNVVVAKNFSSEKDARESAASSSVIKKVLTSGEPVLTFDALSDERFEASRSIVAQQILSITCVPLRLQDKTTGAIYLDSTKSRGKFNAETMKFLAVFGNLAAVAVENAQRYDNLKTENARLKNEVSSVNLFPGIIGKSKAWKAALDLVQRVIDTDVSILITGESGTGKELIARAIHGQGRRRDKAFMAINCSAIPEQLLESELFGYKRGAFTGANVDKKGLIEHADGGTLLLDEVGDLSASLQAKMLRVLQEKEIRRLGDVESRKVDVRVIAATNKDLREETQSGNFREDLYFRLNIVEIHLPPLRNRAEDIPVLINYFMKKACETHGRNVKAIDSNAMFVLLKHPWYGNVRELQNVIERAVVLSRGEELTEEDLRLQKYTEEELIRSGLTLDEFERKLVEKTLAESSGNRTRTAEKLGVSLRWLQYRLKEWGGDAR
ncbi:MAG: sigma 54-interacting transcriptional regulator [Bacteroidetes bacterium]|nr:sigma 54-interacting transcriptional regulator [Bacteroidota bacterium]MCL5738507.1 sigma 54-interacting transcriptional regulator [Bacteroidota bacterium]